MQSIIQLITNLGATNPIQPNNQVVLVQNNNASIQNIESALEKACQKLDQTPTSFDESFPNYDPSEELLPIKVFKNIYSELKKISTDTKEVIDIQKISAEVKNNMFTKDITSVILKVIKVMLKLFQYIMVELYLLEL